MNNQETIFCNLTINQLELPVFLGWTENEREQKQLVSIDIHVNYQTPPLACVTDKLEDTLCYAWLIEEVRKSICAQSFHLVEHLTNTIYAVVNKLIPSANMITVNLTKKPPIEGLKGGVTFSCVSFKESKAV